MERLPIFFLGSSLKRSDNAAGGIHAKAGVEPLGDLEYFTHPHFFWVQRFFGHVEDGSLNLIIFDGRLIVNQHLTLICKNAVGNDIQQSGFAGSIPSQQAANLAIANLSGHISSMPLYYRIFY